MLKANGVKRIYVEDFRDPNGSATPFGAWLASQFASAPGYRWAPIEIVGRDEVIAKLKQRNNPEAIQLNDEEARKLSASIRADIVTGSYGTAEDGIGVTLKVSIDRVRAFSNGKLAMTDVIKSHLSVPLGSLVPADGIFNAEEGECQIQRVRFARLRQLTARRSEVSKASSF